MDNSNPTADLKSVFSPSSIAVIGAGRNPGTTGHDILHNLLEYGFTGALYPVNVHSDYVHSIRAYRSVLDIPDTVELAIICVPKQCALDAVDECGRKGVKAVVMITAGFSETDEKGAELERRIVECLARYKMRMIGPNCMGVINTDPAIRMDATFAATHAVEGRIGFLTQSGSMGVAILERSAQSGLGISSFVSLGNKTDVSIDDMLAYWKDDPRTNLVLLYIESISNPARFIELVREMTGSDSAEMKPVIALKSGRTAAGAKAANSHTASLAVMNVAVDALFESAGVVRVDTMQELFDYAQAFTMQPLPQGSRIAIMSNGGGPGILATDALISSGLDLAVFDDETVAKLRDIVSKDACLTNPMDMIGGSTPAHFEKVSSVILNDPNVDALIVAIVPLTYLDSNEVARGLVRVCNANSHLKKPIIVCLMGRDCERSGSSVLREARIPVYSFPESAVQVMAAMDRLRRIRNRKTGTIRVFEDVDRAKVGEILKNARKDQRIQLRQKDVADLLSAWNIPMLKTRLVTRREDLSQVANEIGFPLVMKVAAEEIIHKSDSGGVLLNLRNEQDVYRAYDEMAVRIAALPQKIKAWAVTLERMLTGGREVVLGTSRDPLFGPLVMVGMGGVYVEVLKDVIFRLAPLETGDIPEMVSRLRGFPILQGVRGESAIHFETLYEQLARLSQLVSEFPEISEMDMNPFLCYSEAGKSVVVDARITLSARDGTN